MKILARYHQPNLRAFNVVRNEAADIDADVTLQMAVKAFNGSVGSDALVSMLVVYCV